MERSTNDGHKKIDYRKGPNLRIKAGEAVTRLSSELRKEFDRLLGLLANKPTVEVEIIATLFADWNDSLIDGYAPSDAEIIRDVREDWHPSKQRTLWYRKAEDRTPVAPKLNCACTETVPCQEAVERSRILAVCGASREEWLDRIGISRRRHRDRKTACLFRSCEGVALVPAATRQAIHDRNFYSPRCTVLFQSELLCSN
jgi:hypothetical protein